MQEQFSAEFPNWEAFRVKLENKSQPKQETQEDDEDEEVEAEETEKETDWWALLNLDYQFSDVWDPAKTLSSYYKKEEVELEQKQEEWKL